MITKERTVELALLSLIEMAGKEVHCYKVLTEELETLLEDIHNLHQSVVHMRQTTGQHKGGK